jgi:NodT family efflux transporter outer membrane factor (OMF) lipoprotein
MTTRSGLAGALAAALVLSSCANPGGIEPTARMGTPQALGAGDVTQEWPQDAWWTTLNDPTLSGLVEQALADSPTLVAAQARMTRAQAAANAAAAAQWPDIHAGLDITRQRYSENGLLPPPIGGSTVTSYDLQLAGSWELDFFGRQRAALASAVSAQKAAAAEQQAARLMLASSVARTYVQLARLVDLREAAVAIRKQREQILELVQGRVSSGLDTKVELRQAEGAVPAISQQIEALQEQMELTRHALAALIGAGPDATAQLTPTLSRIGGARWQQAPRAIPADLVGRRADIAAARWRAEAAARDIDVARAQFYPNVNLIGFVGLSSLTLADWATAGSAVWAVGPAVRLPIFDAGRLRANLQGRTADYDAAVASYNSVLIEAVRDVADQLSSLQAIERQAREQRAAQDAAESALELATLRYQAGLGTFVTVLTAEESVVVQRRSATDLKARAVDVRLQLVRALGGGYADPAGTGEQPTGGLSRQPDSPGRRSAS